MGKHLRRAFYRCTSPSWRTFMCLRCIHGYKCEIQKVNTSALYFLIDDNVVCSMFHKQTWHTKRMQFYHRRNTGRDYYWRKTCILRRIRSRTMLAHGWSAFRRKLEVNDGENTVADIDC